MTDVEEYIDINYNREVTPSTLWDAAKAVIRDHLIQIMSRLKKQREADRLELEPEIIRLEKEHKISRKRQYIRIIKTGKKKTR